MARRALSFVVEYIIHVGRNIEGARNPMMRRAMSWKE